MRLLASLALIALGGALAFVPARAADEDTTRALATLKGVTKEGKGNEDAGPAWKVLVGKGGAALLPTLEAFDDDNATAANWLRPAVDAIAEAETAAGRKLPADALEAFVKDTKHSAAARYLAYELLVAQDAKAGARLLPGFLNDKSADLRRAAISAELDKLEKAPPATTRGGLEKLFTFTRDKDQVELVAKKIEDAGGKVSVGEQFGYVTFASLVAPFDSTGGKGFTVAYPPETATDTAGTFKGKGDAEVKWVAAKATGKQGEFDLNKLLDQYKDAVAYARAVVVAKDETPCEVRVTCPTAVVIFLNGKKLFAREEYHHGDPFDAHVGKGVLKKGENVILLKVCQNNQREDYAQAWQFQMRVCDATGGPLPLEQKVGDKTHKLGFVPEVKP